MSNIYKRIIESQTLYEMALSQSEIEQRVHNMTEVICVHILRCLLIQDSTNNLSHWEDELFGFLPRLPKLKNTNKLPDKYLIYKWFKDEIGDTLFHDLDTEVKNMNSLEKTNVTEYNKQTLYNCIMNYLKWLSSELSKGALNNDLVHEQVDKLVQEYNTQLDKQKVGV